MSILTCQSPRLMWDRVLPGEQQRVAFLRLLLHCPQLAFLDEATGALDTPTEAALYTALRSHCSSFVSVGGQLECAAACHCRNDTLLHLFRTYHCCGMPQSASDIHAAVLWGAGHRSELVQYHTHVLEHGEQGKWAFSTVQEYQSRPPPQVRARVSAASNRH